MLQVAPAQRAPINLAHQYNAKSTVLRNSPRTSTRMHERKDIVQNLAQESVFTLSHEAARQLVKDDDTLHEV